MTAFSEVKKRIAHAYRFVSNSKGDLIKNYRLMIDQIGPKDPITMVSYPDMLYELKTSLRIFRSIAAVIVGFQIGTVSLHQGVDWFFISNSSRSLTMSIVSSLLLLAGNQIVDRLMKSKMEDRGYL